MFIEKIKENFKPGTPILIEDILLLFTEYSRTYIFRLLLEAEEKGEIMKFSRGVYCIPITTFFGKRTTSSSIVAEKKYISNGKTTYGVYSGLTLLNQFAITNQVPNVLEIVTNKEATGKRMINIGGMRFIIRKSRFEITKQNSSYYTILQLFLNLGSNQELNENAKNRIVFYMKDKNLKKDKLIDYAMKFPAQALKNLFRSEVLNELAR